MFLKVLKQTSAGGDETWDAFDLRGFIRKATLQQLAPVAAEKAALSSSVSVHFSPPASQHPPFPSPPDPGSTMAARQPSPCRPPAVSVPCPRNTSLSSSPCPRPPLCPSPQHAAGGEHRGIWGQLEVWMEYAKSDDVTYSEDEMGY